MILTCPSCETRYNLDAALLHPSGRMVRCVKCSHMWTERPPGAAPEAAAPRLTVPDVDEEVGASILQDGDAAERRPAAVAPPPSARRSGAGQLIGWALLVVFIIAVVGGGVFMRHTIVAVWPPATALYQMVGLPVRTVGEGLELRNVTSAQQLENDKPTLVINGEIANISDVVREVPKIRVSLLDVRQREIYSWVFSASSKELAPGQVAAFDTRVAEPPESARGLAVMFYAEEESG